MPYMQIQDAMKRWTKKDNDELGQKIKEEKAKAPVEKTRKWLHERVNMPLTEKGYPGLGAVLAGLGTSAVELSPLTMQGEEDFSAIPFGKFTKGAENALGSNAVGLLPPVEREKSLKRMNAWEAVRKALGKFKAGEKPIGAGHEMAAYDVDGVVVKSPRIHGENSTRWDQENEYIDDYIKHAGHDPEHAKVVAKRDMETKQRELSGKTEARAVKDQYLHDKGLSPETFSAEGPKNSRYILQDKADATLTDDAYRQDYVVDSRLQDMVIQDLYTKAQRDPGVVPNDLYGPNIGRYGPMIGRAEHGPNIDRMGHVIPDLNRLPIEKSPYKVIDSGEFKTPAPSNEDKERWGWRFLKLLKGDK